MMVMEDKYFRHYPDADKYDPKDVKNPEAIGEWLLAYKKIYDLCEKYNCKAWGITDGGGKLHPILTPDEMRTQLYKQFENEFSKNKAMEPELKEIKKKVKSGEDFKTLLTEFKKKHNITSETYEPYWASHE